MPGDAVSHAQQQLQQTIRRYLKSTDSDLVMAACHFANQAHEGVLRKSGEPYIIHPIAVATILASLKMDSDTLIAALLHDVIEDTAKTKDDIASTFSPVIANLVDGVTKLTASSDKHFNKAASFRKILQATLKDPRVIIIKLADRYHNMTTLDALRLDKQQRIAKETFDIFVPIARLVGMNDMADRLEQLCYQYLDPDMFQRVQQATADTQQERLDLQNEWLMRLTNLLQQLKSKTKIKAKNNDMQLLRHFISNHFNLSQLLHSHSFEIVMEKVADCDRFVKILKQNFEIENFRDYIRHPLPGGNQSIKLDIIEQKAPINLTIQTRKMRKAARYGVVLGDSAPVTCRSAIQASLHSLGDIIDEDCAKTTFHDLLDYLHQEKIWVYTPDGDVHELPRGATVVDFAYATSLFLGAHAIGSKIDGKNKPLSTPLMHGQTIQIITDLLASPNPDWLSFVNTQKARRSIQSMLRDQTIEEKRIIGGQALNRALKLFNHKLSDLTAEDWHNLLSWQNVKSKEQIFEQIATGDLLPQLVANHLYNDHLSTSSDNLITGTEGIELKYAHCCNPILGDPIHGHLTRRGLIVHRARCHNLLQQQQQNPENIMPLQWQINNATKTSFTVYLCIHSVLDDEQTSDIIYLVKKSFAGLEEVHSYQSQTFVSIVVQDRQHLAQVIRDMRMILDFPRIVRLSMPLQMTPSHQEKVVKLAATAN